MSTYKVLFTTHLSGANRDLIYDHNLDYKVKSLLSIRKIDRDNWQEQIPRSPDAWIFTSKNAVEAAREWLIEQEKPVYVFAVGPKTGDLLRELDLFPLIPETYNSASLAELIIHHAPLKAVYFKGNLADPAFVDHLEEHEVEITPVVVYETQTRSSADLGADQFQCIVFMSPSSVKAFFGDHNYNMSTDYVCIGPKTAASFKQITGKESYLPEQATFESLIKKIDTLRK